MNPFLSEIIVGIDFGTTYSGVSWAVNGGARKIRLIINWPNPAGRIANSDKVPSLITYKDGKPDKWGYSVKLSEQSFKWIKILLEPELESKSKVRPVRDTQKLLEELGKTADEVVADYLHLLWEYTVDDIKKHQGPDFETTYNISIILTVPAMWSPAAKDRTLRAARAAGMPSNITLVTEPEAAALSTLKDKEGMAGLKKGDAFIICDAGGGTVDLISYRVAGVEPLQVEECIVGIGELCGSVFLDSEFEKYISTIVGEAAYMKIREENRKKMLQEFEYGIKRAFCGDEEEQYSVDLKGVRDNIEHGILDGTITVKGPLLKTMFDRICGSIEYLVDQQLADVKEKGLQVKAILLVGGFGENRYLHNRLESCYKSSGIKVLQNSEAWSSICRGATLWGLEHPHTPTKITEASLPIRSSTSVLSRRARYSLGIFVHIPFEEGKHLPEDRFIHPAQGIPYATNQMIWLVKWGEDIEEGKTVKGSGITYLNMAELKGEDVSYTSALFYCRERSPPSRRTNTVKSLCQVHVTIPVATLDLEQIFVNPTDKERYIMLPRNIEIVFQNADLDFRVIHNGKVIGHCVADYMKTCNVD